MINKGLLFASAAIVSLSAAGAFLHAQPQMQVPQPSPGAAVTQTIGITDVTVTYHRPGVKNRKIWGGLVPYDQVWRAGANENTTISFGDPVKIEGKDLPAGTYGLHMIPTKGSWTIIFSKNSTSWGSFFYNEKEDALRVSVTPQSAPLQEWLDYSFADLTPKSAELDLTWEKIRVPIRIDLDVDAIVLQHAENEYMRGLAGFSWQAFAQAASYCLQHNVDVDRGLAWADKSIAMNENATNLVVKAGLLDKTGKKQEAEKCRRLALEKATTEAQVNQLGYQYLGLGNLQEAIAVFKKNVKDYPDSWNVYDSLGEAYENAGETGPAIENYEQALKRVKDEAQKNRITGTLQRLRAK